MLWFANGSGLEMVVLLTSHTKTNGLWTSAGARRAEWVEPPPALRIAARVGPQPHPVSFPFIYRHLDLRVFVSPSANTPSQAQLSVQLLIALKNCITLAILRKTWKYIWFLEPQIFYSRVFFLSKYSISLSAKKKSLFFWNKLKI